MSSWPQAIFSQGGDLVLVKASRGLHFEKCGRVAEGWR